MAVEWSFEIDYDIPGVTIDMEDGTQVTVMAHVNSLSHLYLHVKWTDGVTGIEGESGGNLTGPVPDVTDATDSGEGS